MEQSRTLFQPAYFCQDVEAAASNLESQQLSELIFRVDPAETCLARGRNSGAGNNEASLQSASQSMGRPHARHDGEKSKLPKIRRTSDSFGVSFQEAKREGTGSKARVKAGAPAHL